MSKKKKRNKFRSGLVPLAKTLPTRTEQTVTVQGSFHSGPLPSPEALEKYEKISPGFAERIVKMAETEQEHRHKIEIEIIGTQKSDSRWEYFEAFLGQVCGLIIGIFTIGAGAYTSLNGAPFAGGLIGTAGVGGLVSVFIYGRKNRPNLKDNSKALTNIPPQ